MHMLCTSGGDRPIFRNYGALADQNRSVTLALKLVLRIDPHILPQYPRLTEVYHLSIVVMHLVVGNDP